MFGRSVVRSFVDVCCLVRLFVHSSDRSFVRSIVRAVRCSCRCCVGVSIRSSVESCVCVTGWLFVCVCVRVSLCLMMFLLVRSHVRVFDGLLFRHA